jgi:hypothetical protein
MIQIRFLLILELRVIQKIHIKIWGEGGRGGLKKHRMSKWG